ncbi:KIR protein [Plasmodium coatneyi]|uniref:KIR protein n=1 Tax=Plasmodium coatneyi TaxID=208452 RepID=A0A1B1DX90_9APIC|nr:KIR protein [Plasmodium coatneyi]ANQ07374.1 KIR protein [Plasmodium coatneyi]
MNELRNPLSSTSLPAHKYFYDPFKTDAETCTDNRTVDIQTKLTQYSSYGIHVNQIEEAICFVSKIHIFKKYPKYNDRWHFLYYWVGEQIWNALGKSDTDKKNQFPTILKEVCNIIKTKCERDNVDGSGKCELLCPEQMDGTTFEQDKKVFDFFSNYNEIKNYVYGGEADCQTHWPSYKSEVESACTTVENYCKKVGTHEREPYCINFPQNHGVYCKMTLQKLECKSPQDAVPEEQESTCPSEDANTQLFEERIRSATTTASISSILGTLGLTVVPYVLYKV